MQCARLRHATYYAARSGKVQSQLAFWIYYAILYYTILYSRISYCSICGAVSSRQSSLLHCNTGHKMNGAMFICDCDLRSLSLAQSLSPLHVHDINILPYMYMQWVFSAVQSFCNQMLVHILLGCCRDLLCFCSLSCRMV